MTETSGGSAELRVVVAFSVTSFFGYEQGNISNGGSVRRHVFCHHRICANSDWPQDLCASSDVDMAAYDRDPWSTPDTQSDLLKNETVHANSGVGVNNDSVGMRDQESPANLTIERDVCPRDDAP